MHRKTEQRREKFREDFIEFLKEDPRVREAMEKTYGPKVYGREIKRISAVTDLAEKAELFRFIKTICPSVYSRDRELWEDFIFYLESETDVRHRDHLLYLLPYFRPADSIHYILDLLMGEKKIQDEETRNELFNILQERYLYESVPYLMMRKPLQDLGFMKILLPYFIRIGAGSLKTIFERVSEFFVLSAEEMIEPFLESFLKSDSIPIATHPFLLRHFIIPSIEKYPHKAPYLISKILACQTVERVDEYLPILEPHLERLCRQEKEEDVAIAMHFFRRFPSEKAVEYVEELFSRFPEERADIISCFKNIKSKRLKDVFLHYFRMASREEKDLILAHLLADPDDKIMEFMDKEFKKSSPEEKYLFIKNLWLCPHPAGMDWIRFAFESDDEDLIAVCMDKLHYIGNFFNKDEFNKMIRQAHQLGITVNKGILNPLMHMLNPGLCGEMLKNLRDLPTSVQRDRLSFAGYYADEKGFDYILPFLEKAGVSHEAITALVASRDPRAVPVIEELYDKSPEQEKSFIVDTITQFQDYRFTGIIEKEVLNYYQRVDSFTFGTAFPAPVGRKEGFEILKKIYPHINPTSVQFILETALYGGEEARILIEEIFTREEVRDTPRKRLGCLLALYITGDESLITELVRYINDEYLCEYLLYLLKDISLAQETILLPRLERYAPLNLKPFIDRLFSLLNRYYPWDPVYDRVLAVLSVGVDESRIEKLSQRLMGEFVEIKLPILSAIERVPVPALIPQLRDKLHIMESINTDQLTGYQEIYYRMAYILHRLGDSRPFLQLKNKYRRRFFNFIKEPMRFINDPIFIPDLAQILDEQEKIHIFLDKFGTYMADPGDLRFNEEAFLKMIEGIKDPRFIPLIVENLRLCQKDLDLIPALTRLHELTGETHGVEYYKWVSYLKADIGNQK